MNWKEKFRNQVLPIDEDVAIELQINFISTEIIEKLIEEIPESLRGYIELDTKVFKQQLRAKWLKDEKN